ncbi:MAG: 4Fe-4S binding protein [Syntrophales bacterium]
MVKIKYVARVDREECIGCGRCVIVCPTGAIFMREKKAQVNEDKCLACQNCAGICSTYAISKVSRPKPLVLGVNYEEVDQKQLRELCEKAHLHPMQWHCLCTAVRVREGAAAVLKGAKTPEEISLMTGVASGCTAYCRMVSLRLLKAHGVEVKETKYRLYNTTQTLWDVPEEMKKKYPGYFLEEDKHVFRKF